MISLAASAAFSTIFVDVELIRVLVVIILGCLRFALPYTKTSGITQVPRNSFGSVRM